MSSSSTYFGGVSEEEIEAAAVTEAGLPGGAEASPLGLFVRRVARLICYRTVACEIGKFAVFLLTNRATNFASHCSGNPHPTLCHGNTPILDHVWITSAPLGDARIVNIVASDIGEAFASIEESPFSDLPAIFIDWEGPTPKATLYQYGVIKPDEMEEIDVSGKEISALDMKAALDHCYLKRLRAPQLIVGGGGQPLWKKASTGVPYEEPEKRIQGRLMDTLQSKFPTHELHPELNIAEGRADIIVWSKTEDPSGKAALRYDWLLELKVLRDKTPSEKRYPQTTNRKAIVEGTDQAIRYMEESNALNAALCCFDLREPDVGDPECFAEVVDLADENDVHLWRWFLYRSAQKLRKALKTAAIAEK